jgi:hypothetical protein
MEAASRNDVLVGQVKESGVGDLRWPYVAQVLYAARRAVDLYLAGLFKCGNFGRFGTSFGRYRIGTVASFGSATDLQSSIEHESVSHAAWMYTSIGWPGSAWGENG